MFCSKCGREIPDDSRVCGYCGAPGQGERQQTEYNQTQNIYGEPKVNYSGQGGNYQSNSQYRNQQQTAYQSGAQTGQQTAYHSGTQTSQGAEYQNGTQFTQGNTYQSSYSQNTGYGAPQNMDGGSTGMGIISMILGIVALLMSCCVSKWWLTLIVAACSIVLGILSIQKNSEGKGMAIAGIVCSCIAVLMGVIVLALGAAFASFIFSFLRSV